jgi:hypothetical protein
VRGDGGRGGLFAAGRRAVCSAVHAVLAERFAGSLEKGGGNTVGWRDARLWVGSIGATYSQ